MSAAYPSASLGRLSFEAAQRIKAMLSPLEDVCRYREQRSDDVAQYDVKPRNKKALSFNIAIAPGGINLESSLATIRELPVSQAGIAYALVEAIVHGRVHFIRRLKANGQARVTKVYFFDAEGRMIFRQRKSSGWLVLASAAVKTERLRFAPYRS
jgi:hypothetical protein